MKLVFRHTGRLGRNGYVVFAAFFPLHVAASLFSLFYREYGTLVLITLFPIYHWKSIRPARLQVLTIDVNGIFWTMPNKPSWQIAWSDIISVNRGSSFLSSELDYIKIRTSTGVQELSFRSWQLDIAASDVDDDSQIWIDVDVFKTAFAKFGVNLIDLQDISKKIQRETLL